MGQRGNVRCINRLLSFVLLSLNQEKIPLNTSARTQNQRTKNSDKQQSSKQRTVINSETKDLLKTIAERNCFFVDIIRKCCQAIIS
jgi:hypothetical protein